MKKFLVDFDTNFDSIPCPHHNIITMYNGSFKILRSVDQL